MSGIDLCCACCYRFVLGKFCRFHQNIWRAVQSHDGLAPAAYRIFLLVINKLDTDVYGNFMDAAALAG